MVTLPKILTLAKLYSYHTNNPLGANEDEVLESLQVMYVEWRAVEGHPRSKSWRKMSFRILLCPSQVGMFIADGHSKTGVLKLLHGFASAAGRANPDCQVIFV
jgi:hypothetical protein